MHPLLPHSRLEGYKTVYEKKNRKKQPYICKIGGDLVVEEDGWTPIQIHKYTVYMVLELAKRFGKPDIFQYLYANWFRTGSPAYGRH